MYTQIYNRTIYICDLDVVQSNDYGYPTSQVATVDKAPIERIYEYATPSILYGYTTSVEEEQIYETPYGDEDDYVPVYDEPPNEMNQLYKTFKGKIFYPENIR